MGAASKRARRIRSAAEFQVARLRNALVAPKVGGIPLTSWSLADIFAARDAQLRGDFNRPAKMAEAMRTDDALAVPFKNRLAPQQCIKVKLKPAKVGNARAISICAEAEAQFGQNGVAVHADTLASIHECLTNHDVAFAHVTAIPREDGTRVDYEVKAWPIEHVRWDAYEKVFKTRVDPGAAEAVGGEVTIVHGDGRWIIFQRFENEPFKHGTILAAALVWARHAYALRDWAKGSVAHGNAKVVGALPEGVPLQDADGNLTPEAEAMAEALRAIGSSDSPSVIKPAKSTIDFITNNSAAWQVFDRLVANAEKSGARLYLGTDGTLGASGSAPGVDIVALFGVARTYIQSDVACISRGLQTGAIEPWTAINFGDSSLAPERVYVLPDEDDDAVRAALAARKQAFYAEIEKAKANGFVVDQAFVDQLAEEHGIEPPTLPVESEKAPSIALAPTDIARVVTVNEARASAGVGPLVLPVVGGLDPDGNLTVEQFAVKKAAQVAQPAPPLAPAA